ncbi:MAG: hypothetical protein J1F04_04390 [Oscillospiraceae bacterium]|nr:hypothetical protein [Oscillospiraceae bacterium]
MYYSPIVVLLGVGIAFLQIAVPTAGLIMLIIGIVKRVKTKNDFKPRGLSLIITGAVMFLPGGILLGGYVADVVTQAADDYNNINHQLSEGSVEDVERLLKKGVNAKGESYTREDITSLLGDVAKYSRVIPDSVEKAELLIEYGADVNMVMCDTCDPDHSRYRRSLCSATPVLFACDTPNYDMLKALIDSGGDVNAVDYYGYSALDIVERNIIDDDDRFHYSYTSVFERMKELLIENGAEYSTAEKPSKTGPDKNRY